MIDAGERDRLITEEREELGRLRREEFGGEPRLNDLRHWRADLRLGLCRRGAKYQRLGP